MSRSSRTTIQAVSMKLQFTVRVNFPIDPLFLGAGSILAPKTVFALDPVQAVIGVSLDAVAKREFLNETAFAIAACDWARIFKEKQK